MDTPHSILEVGKAAGSFAIGGAAMALGQYIEVADKVLGLLINIGGFVIVVLTIWYWALKIKRFKKYGGAENDQ
jgi:hypothetical protein